MEPSIPAILPIAHNAQWHFVKMYCLYPSERPICALLKCCRRLGNVSHMVLLKCNATLVHTRQVVSDQKLLIKGALHICTQVLIPQEI